MFDMYENCDDNDKKEFVIDKNIITSQSWKPLPKLMKTFLSLLGTEIIHH